METSLQLTPDQLVVSDLGPRRYPSPLAQGVAPNSPSADYVSDDTRVVLEPRFGSASPLSQLGFEFAGPRANLYFDPRRTTAALVTCGGLCPGLNNVVRALTLALRENYRAARVLGLRYGFRGLNPNLALPPVELTTEVVAGIHHLGGTFLGTSRGKQETAPAVDHLQALKVDVLFCIGGDGTQRGAHALAQEVARRNAPIAIVGIPQTTDNDIRFCFRSFGFSTAVAEAEQSIDRAHVEARSVLNGVGLVKLMGREAGFIAAAAALASGEANFCLIPEIPLEIDGPQGFLERLKRRLLAREHAVVVVAEGAGQNLLTSPGASPGNGTAYDPSGNRRLGDIGVFLRQRIEAFFAAEQIPVSVKYFDPSYQIRSVPASADDSLLCERFARAAVHAAMAGKTDVLIGMWHNHLVHVPLKIATGETKRLDPQSELWRSVLAATGQERW